MSMKMLWLLALICRDFPCIICSKKSDLLLALKMLWWWFARNRQQARGTLPPCLHCQTATGKQPPRVGSPPGYRREWRIKKIPGGGFLALGMIPSAVKVGLNLVDPSDIRRPWMMMGRASAAALAVFG